MLNRMNIGIRMKRAYSDDGSDFAEDEAMYKESSPDQSCGGGPSRKRRRGIVEKRRRDRINQSLIELKRLVPAAYEKQGSAKLEKAEILQMTVDHLKILQQKGITGYSADQASMAIDYRTIGFRECASEAARYLVAVEGMDIQNPLRIRLLSHLESFCAQREAAARASLQQNQWSSSIPYSQPTYQYTTPNSSQTYQSACAPPTQESQNNLSTTQDNIHSLTPPTLLSSKPYRPWGAELAY